MKTKLLSLLLIIIAFSSCNTAKQYANYRFGGKSDREKKIILKEKESEEIATIIPEEIRIDSVCNAIAVETIEIETLPVIDKKSLTETKQNSIEEIPLNEKSQNSIPMKNKKSSVIHSIKTKIQGNKNLHFMKSKQANASETFDTIIGIISLVSLILAVFAYLASVNFAIGEVLLIALLIGVAILLCIGLGKLILGIFPGMSKKKKNSILNFLNRFLFIKRNNKSGMKYYGGVSAAAYFWIGLVVIGLSIVIMALIGASDLGWTILMTALSIHLFLSALVALVEGIGNALSRFKKK